MTNTNQTSGNSGEKTSFFRVSGLDCGSCAVKIETSLGRIPGVETVDASISSETVAVQHNASVSMAMLANKLDALGYGVAAMADRREKLSGTSPAHSSQVRDHRDHDHAAHGEDEDKDEDEHHLHSHNHDDDRPWWRKPDGMLVIISMGAVALSYLLGLFSPVIQQAALLGTILVAIRPVAIKAWRSLRSGFPFSIESLLVVAAIGAVALGAIEEAAFVVLLFLIGELLEGIASGQARRGIRGLTDLIPKTAFIENEEGSLAEVPISGLKIGSIIVVRPGDRISADGVIVSGVSSIDDSPVTGESAPKTKNPGDQVFAGSINHDAALRIRVTSDSSNNTIARIARLVEEAQERKSPTQRFINRFSRIYTPIIFATGLAVAVVPPLFGAEWLTWIYRGLAVLLIGCPCALVISTPAAIASGIAAGARQGLLLKGGEVLEKLAGVTVAAFDKTGTLTTGTPSVTDLYAYGNSDMELLATAASIEASSSHPLAKAIVAHAGQKGIPVKASADTGVIVGKGVRGVVNGEEVFVGSPKSSAELASFTPEQQEHIRKLHEEGKTVAVVVTGRAVTGIIGLRDEAKPDAIDGVAELRREGVRALMLTGDNRATAEAIGAQLGIEVHSELLPQDKMEIVKSLQAKGDVVAKIGDGINDAPALAAAGVGIAMAGGPGGGTDIALETGDAAILQGRVADVARLVDLARRTMRNIYQNLTIAIGLKVVFLITTIIGITGLWPAILADTGATILVTANALRLLKTRNA